ncbi:protein phosphatase 1 regulatory subunit 3A [Trematomus bernacchii]|uniref:protein phosphatase 1 regulatory subunit 3A n=1 Tax=Trematomus bernacchii TaxID=40690 RepID=UPI00146BF870|nr:protein phosphatase 1 regulatory subunit 3A [Trematomus bernacchii]
MAEEGGGGQRGGVSLQPGYGHSALCYPPSQTDGRTGRQLPLRPPHIMEGTHIQPMEEDGAVMEEEEMQINGEQEEGEMEASEEETDEDCEPEPPHVIRRKVSFADAFGLNLVSVKEYDNVTESEVSQPTKSEAIPLLEEFYMSCLFTAPSSPEELDQRLQTQMVELESMELLPGTTTLRGTIRVVNLCYSKSVYARMTLDRWTSQFDLLAEYVPGSSDRKTDRFTFMYTLVPPFDREGARVEISLRYETSVGTFWANNAGLNYVLFCHQKGHVKEHVLLVQEESHIYKSKRSCLKAIMKGTAEENIEDSCNTSTAAAEAEATHKAEEANRRGSTDIQSLLDREERNTLVDSINSRHRAARLARVKEYLSQRSQHMSKAHSHDSATSQGVSQPLPAQWVDSASFLHQRQKKQSNESPQVLTYHQIPLLTLDWNNDKAHEWGAPEMRDIWTGTAKMTLSKASEEKTPSVNDMWEAFGNRTDDSGDKETSVCDVWQAFLNEPSCTDRSAVPESEWLQTAASVSPSNDKEPNARNTASSQEQEFQVGTDTPTTLHAHTLAVCQLLSDSLPANVALNTEDLQPAEACVSSPRDGDTVTRDTSQRSQTNSVTDTPQIFCLKGATQVSEGSVDSSTECHELTIWGQGREEIIGGAEGIGQDEPFTQYTHDLVTSSGESETTDMTAMPESQNATADDRISQGLDEGLSSSREGEVTVGRGKGVFLLNK